MYMFQLNYGSSTILLLSFINQKKLIDLTRNIAKGKKKKVLKGMYTFKER